VVNYHRMKSNEHAAVVGMIKELIADYGTSFRTNLTEEILRESGDILNVEVAEQDGEIIGICAWIMTFSTWRGGKGIYLTDHYVRSTVNKRLEVARKLLHLAVTNSRAQGATFVRTERDLSDELMEGLYGELKFWDQRRHILCFMEPENFRKFAETEV
jgi:hypothetical protein